MANKLDNLAYDLGRLLTKSDAVVEFVKMLRERNKYNIEAITPIIKVDHTVISIENLEYSPGGDDGYEVLTGYRVDDDGNQYSSFEEFAKDWQEKAKDKYEIKKTWELYLHGCVSPEEEYHTFSDLITEIRNYDEDDFEVKFGYAIYEDGDRADFSDDLFDSERAAENAIEEYLSDEDVAREEFDSLDYEGDEVIYNYVHRYSRYTDTELALRIGLAVVRINKENHDHEGDDFLAFTSCGMDLSPKLVAYQALTFGGVMEEDIKHFTSKSSRSYFEYVVGHDIAQEVYRKLGILEAIQFEEAPKEITPEQPDEYAVVSLGAWDRQYVRCISLVPINTTSAISSKLSDAEVGEVYLVGRFGSREIHVTGIGSFTIARDDDDLGYDCWFELVNKTSVPANT